MLGNRETVRLGLTLDTIKCQTRFLLYLVWVKHLCHGQMELVCVVVKPPHSKLQLDSCVFFSVGVASAS